jgi:hypothetical protein
MPKNKLKSNKNNTIPTVHIEKQRAFTIWNEDKFNFFRQMAVHSIWIYKEDEHGNRKFTRTKQTEYYREKGTGQLKPKEKILVKYDVQTKQYFAAKVFIYTNFLKRYRKYMANGDEAILSDQDKALITEYLHAGNELDKSYELYLKIQTDPHTKRVWELFIERDKSLDRKQKERYKYLDEIKLSPFIWHWFEFEYPYYEEFREIGFYCDKLVLSFQIDIHDLDWTIFDTEKGETVSIGGLHFEVQNSKIGFDGFCKLLHSPLMALSFADVGKRQMVKSYVEHNRKQGSYNDLHSDWKSEYVSDKDARPELINCELQYNSLAIYQNNFHTIWKLFRRDQLIGLNWKQIDFAYDFTVNDTAAFIEEIEMDKKKFTDSYIKPMACGTHHFTNVETKYFIKLYDSAKDKEKKKAESGTGLHFYQLYNEKKHIISANPLVPEKYQVIKSDLDFCETIVRFEFSLKRGALNDIRKTMNDALANKDYLDRPEFYKFPVVEKSNKQNVRMYYEDDTITPYLSYLLPYVELKVFNDGFQIKNDTVRDNLKAAFRKHLTNELHMANEISKADVSTELYEKQAVGCLNTAINISFLSKNPIFKPAEDEAAKNAALLSIVDRVLNLIDQKELSAELDKDLISRIADTITKDAVSMAFERYYSENYQKLKDEQIPDIRKAKIMDVLSSLADSTAFEKAGKQQINERFLLMSEVG